MVASLSPASLRCEYLVDPVGIDIPQPRLSWTLASDGPDQRQSAYRIIVAENGESLSADGPLLWDSGKVESNASINVEYQGPTLRSGQRCWWAVRVWDQDGAASDFSAPAFWEMGLLDPSDWTGNWIAMPGEVTRRPAPNVPNGTLRPLAELDLEPSPYLRTEFALSSPVRQARVYATARGVYELSINGHRVGDQVLAPGWTEYSKRLQYQTYDVTSLLQNGANAIGAILGTGWYAGHIGWHGENKHYGLKPQLLLQLVIEHEDGTTLTVGSDDSWKSSSGPLLYSDMLAGESYDAWAELPGWDKAGFDDGAWQAVEVTARDETRLVADRAEPVRVTEEVQPRSITQVSPDTAIVDMGQNMAGWVRLRVSGPAGTTVRLRFNERLDADGSFYIDGLRSAHQTDFYTLKGDGLEEYEPRFTFHGFQYVEVTGYPGELTLDAITGRVVGSDTALTGEFTTSNAMVNQLQHNIVWGQRGNFLSVPTDCPQRDERLGWLGDAQVFVRTSCFNADAAAFWTKWLEDVDDARSPNGAYPNVAPKIIVTSDGAPAWGNAGVILPWTLYLVYGDTRILETHYAAMTKWLHYLLDANPDLLWKNLRSNDFGDWVAMGEETSKEMIGTAYLAQDAHLLSRIAGVLGYADDQQRYAALFEQIKQAYQQAYVSDDGRVLGDSQTAYCLALAFDLLPESLRAAAADHLVANIKRHNWHLTTGFVGVSHLCPVLTKSGHADVAYRLLLNEDFPSWGYMIARGATTMWERWDGWTEEKGFQTPVMNSFNHYAFGAIGDWLYRYVAGIDTDPAAPGYERVVIRPYPGGLRSVSASYQSVRGEIASAWEHEDNRFTLNVTIPANATATLHIPCDADGSVTRIDSSGGESEVNPSSRDNGRVQVEVGSGMYRFQSKLTSN